MSKYVYFYMIFSKSSDQEEEFPFVEQPSEDFFCPVTCDLLLHPHLTACCGKHLSQEAATRIQGNGGACPMCKEPHLKTMLDKRFLRQVNELRVFCRHEDRGVWVAGRVVSFQMSCSILSHENCSIALQQ